MQNMFYFSLTRHNALWKTVDTCPKTGSPLTIYVGHRVVFQHPVRLLDHLVFGLGPVKEGFLELALKHFHEAVGVGMVMDAAAR